MALPSRQAVRSGTSGLLSYFTRHRTAANLLLLLLVSAGLAALPQMRAQFFPDTVTDEIEIGVTWEGAGAEDIDATIVELLSPVLMAIDGVDETSSRAREGSARIELEFAPGTDMTRAGEEVDQAIDGLTTLPEEAEVEVLSRSSWSDRVTDVIIQGPVGVEQLAGFADEFAVRLFAEGVTKTTIRGIAAPRIVVEVPTANLMRHGLTMREIADAIGAEAAADPAGDVSGANARVRTGQEKRTAEEVERIVLRSDTQGGQLTVGDVATVLTEGVARERRYFVGDDPAVSMRVDRSAEGDALKIQAAVERVAAELEPGLPQGVEIDLIRTRAESISSRLNTLVKNAALGLGLVLLTLFLLLNARTAFWVAMGIPVALLAAIALMWAAGLTINMISLFALLLTLGIVVDDAIVVGEHADYRARTLGEPPAVAAERTASRMAGPVFSASLTTIIAFSALFVIEGRFGDMIADIPFTVIVVLIASLVECFLILPNHMAHSLAASQKQEAWYDWPSRQVNRGFDRLRDRAFRPFMRLVIRARYPVIAGLFVLLASQVSLLVTGEVQWRFFSAPEEGSVSGNFAMAPGATEDDGMAQLRALQAAVERVGADYEAEHGINPVAYALAEIGGNTGRSLPGADDKESWQLGSIAVELIDPDARTYSSFDFVRRLQDEVERHPQVETISFRGWRSGPGGDALDVELFGAGTATLKEAAERLKAELAQFPEVSALEDSLSYDKEELILDLTPQGAALGFSIDELGRVLRNRLGGIEAATFPIGPRTSEIRVELPGRELTADFLDRTQLRTEAGFYVPLADIVEVERRQGFSVVNRENGLRVVSVTGDIADDDAARAAEIRRALEERLLPALEEEFGVGWRLSGLAEQERSFLTDASVGFGFCLLGIYLVLAWVFASWFRPLLIMAVIPFGLIGAIYGHALWGVPLSMFSVVGLIGMSGIIINDSIVLVSTVDEYAESRGLIPAIVDGTCDRLRPVLLTTLTTVFGLAPLLYEPSTQAQFLKPTVLTLVFGLGFGVLLVLLIVPALLAMQADIRRQFEALRRAAAFPARARAVSALTLGAALALALLFAATLGHALAAGGLWPPLAGLLPGGSEAGPTLALAAFLALGGVLLVAVYALGAALHLRVPRPRPAE
ncbi:MAG: efflux RND transporter permease subunit [Paracoccaceae bacterium]|jgi:multidrug efflux pump subunit AcrB|nr:efflux RND transporter permease subunit [Paracoccaceae bacterium]